MWTFSLLTVGAAVAAVSPWIPMLDQWGPLLLLWTGGGAHLAMIVRREEKVAARREMRRAA